MRIETDWSAHTKKRSVGEEIQERGVNNGGGCKRQGEEIGNCENDRMKM